MKALVMMSGGLDSAVALVALKRDPSITDIAAVWVNYGQGNRNREKRAASDVARLTHVGGRAAEFVEIDVSLAMAPFWSAAPLLNGNGVPDELPGKPAVDVMFVPGRNSVLMSLGLAVAQARGAHLLVMGMHGGDRANFLDCRPDWIRAASGVCALHGVMLNAPWEECSKADIVRKGVEYGLPLNLTWSCYRSGPLHCGACPACRSRLAAFEEAGVLDPLLFVNRWAVR